MLKLVVLNCHLRHFTGRALLIKKAGKSSVGANYPTTGMIASVAVRSGFDYVYLKNRQHIHLSVKPG